MTKIIIGDKIVFYKITSHAKGYKSGKSVYIDKAFDEKDKYDVYRASISKYDKWELGNGWNLYKNLDLKTAIKAAKNALKYL